MFNRKKIKMLEERMKLLEQSLDRCHDKAYSAYNYVVDEKRKNVERRYSKLSKKLVKKYLKVQHNIDIKNVYFDEANVYFNRESYYNSFSLRHGETSDAQYEITDLENIIDRMKEEGCK